MSHNLEQISEGRPLSALVIRGRGASSRPASSRNYARITKLGGDLQPWGIRIKARHLEDDRGVTVDIDGEDLYALREFLAELPEEAFVRPADPVIVPDRWTDGDILEEHYGPNRELRRIWSRVDGAWVAPGGSGPFADEHLMHGMRRPADLGWYVVPVRQASGQDLGPESTIANHMRDAAARL